MRKLLFFAGVALLFTSASPPREDPLTAYVPIMMSRDQLNTCIAEIGVQPLKKTGKIYKLGNTLFVIETNKGIHVFDNANPESPYAVGFIRVPGCVDMSIKDKMLYADNATDLVTIDISDPKHVLEVDREMNVFPEKLPPDQKRLPIAYAKQNRPKNLIIVGWELKSEAE